LCDAAQAKGAAGAMGDTAAQKAAAAKETGAEYAEKARGMLAWHCLLARVLCACDAFFRAR
jgi:hypothetical protein